jgi:hypothetical protein
VSWQRVDSDSRSQPRKQFRDIVVLHCDIMMSNATKVVFATDYICMFWSSPIFTHDYTKHLAYGYLSLALRKFKSG